MALKVFKNKGETNAIPINSENLNFNFSEILNLIYPIGRGFIDFTDTDYSNYLGFTWQRTLLGVSPVGYNPEDADFNVIGKNGGEKEHTLTINEMPKHNHTSTVYSKVQGGNSASTARLLYADNTTTQWISEGNPWVDNTGGNQSHNNMHPYEVVAYWKRIA